MVNIKYYFEYYYSDNAICTYCACILKECVLFCRKQSKLDQALEELDEKDADNVNLSKRSTKKKRDSYDYINTVQMLGELWTRLAVVEYNFTIT